MQYMTWLFCYMKIEFTLLVYFDNIDLLSLVSYSPILQTSTQLKLYLNDDTEEYPH